MTRPPVAISLDVGGVLVVPDHGLLGGALEEAGIEHDRAAFWAGHYRAMAAVDEAASRPEDFTEYLPAFAASIGVPEDRVRSAVLALERVFGPRLWCQPVPGSRAALAALSSAGVRLGVTSNSDGALADFLRRHEWLQIGAGPGVVVEAITDSGALGFAKPDARLFAATVSALGVPATEVVHVGDSVHFDVEAAQAAGLQAVHFDPLGLCAQSTHAHLAALTDLLNP